MPISAPEPITAGRSRPQGLAGHAGRLAKAVLPERLAYRLARLIGREARPPTGAVRFGDLARARPVSTRFGYDRGAPVDRYYIEDFLSRSSSDVHGRVLEIGGDDYTRRYGGDRVAASDILHVDDSNPRATIIGDLAGEVQAADGSFDCIILTQTLHLIYDMEAALTTVHRLLRPGGVVLATVPGISPIDRGEWGATWFWSLNDLSARRLFESAFPADSVRVETYGNVFAAVAFLHGLAQEEVPQSLLDPRDRCLPVVVAIRAQRPLAAAGR